MVRLHVIRAIVARTLLVSMMLSISACSMFLPAPDEPEVVAIPEPESEPVIEPEPQAEPEPVPVVRPEPPPPEPELPTTVAPLVAVIVSDRTPAYTDVATALHGYLENYDTYDLSDRSLTIKDAFESIAASEAKAVVAIGLPAAAAAKQYASVPVVVGQVFNLAEHGLLGGNVKAVASLPPVGQQIDAWRELDPSIRNIGAILGEGHDALIEATNAAMQERGINFHYAIASSDRETLYLFNRLIRDVDGYILFPDNRILSRFVLETILKDAVRQHVQVSVFNEPLLNGGATFSASTVPEDIATQISRVLNRLLTGDIDAVPALTELTAVRIRTNPAILKKLGLDKTPAIAGKTMAGGL